MSKSKKNTIDPEEIINNYGADAVRLFILSDSPPEKDIQWSDEGIISSHKFLQKLWVLNLSIKEQIEKDMNKDHSNIIEKYTNKFIKVITEYLEKFNYNKIIATIHEMHSFFAKNLKKGFTKETLITNYSKILIVMMPVTPHFASECLKNLKINESDISWPNINEKILIEDHASFVIQINGKTRGIIKGPIHSTEKEIISMVEQDKNLKKYIEQKEIQRKIFIPKRLLNIIV